MQALATKMQTAAARVVHTHHQASVISVAHKDTLAAQMVNVTPNVRTLSLLDTFHCHLLILQH